MGFSPSPATPSLHVHPDPVPPFSTLKSLNAALASYSFTVPSQRCRPCRLCLAWLRRQGLYISRLPHSTPSGDKDFGGVQWGRDYNGVNKLEKWGEERPAYGRRLVMGSEAGP